MPPSPRVRSGDILTSLVVFSLIDFIKGLLMGAHPLLDIWLLLDGIRRQERVLVPRTYMG